MNNEKHDVLFKLNTKEDIEGQFIVEAPKSIDLSEFDDFTEPHEVMKAFHSLMPDEVILNNCICSSKTLTSIGFIDTLVAQSLNLFLSRVLKIKSPVFEGELIKENVPFISDVLFEPTGYDPDYHDIIESISPILFKNFHLFAEQDIILKNSSNVRNMHSKFCYFLNNDGEFVNLSTFLNENHTDFKKLNSTNLDEGRIYNYVVDYTNRENKKNYHIKALKETVLLLDKESNKQVHPKNIQDKIDFNESFKGKKIHIIEKNDIQSILNDHNSHSDDVIKRQKILRKNAHIHNGIPLIPARKDMLNNLNELKKNYPNFAEVIDHISGSLCISLLQEHSEVSFSPILLCGSPGIGKTAFSEALAVALETKTENWQIPQINQGFTLSGLDLGWASGKPGKIFNSFVKLNVANPIILLDEFDKEPQDSSQGGSVSNIFLQLFETESAKNFTDEALDLAIDASHINWICTANDINEIPQTLLTRLKLFHVKKPNSNEMESIINSIYTKLLKNEVNGNCFSSTVPDSFINQLLEFEPRKIRKILQDTMRYSAQAYIRSNSELNGEIVISLDEISLKKALKTEPNQKRKNLNQV